MPYTYPHTIQTDVEELTFVGIRRDDRGDWLEVHNRVAPDKGPPMHVHHRQEEGLTVEQGRIGYQIEGEEPEFAGVGETVIFAPGTPHRFWNAGSQELLCTGFIRPPENVEYFLAEIYDSINRSGNGRPESFEAAWLLHRYRSEFDMTSIPGFVKKVIFPIQRTIGRLTGRYRRYADAPPPIDPNTPVEILNVEF
jgi:mannose-6-phosphate isomerase-like protein (cupin superfamily)